MRRAMTTFAAAVTLLGIAAPAAFADPGCPPVGRAYVSLANPQPGGDFGQFQAFLARGGDSDFGHQVSREGRTDVPCP